MSTVSAQRLAEVCMALGARVPAWTQGAGANVSVKDGALLYVKASGVRLDAVRTDAGIARVDLEAARRAWAALREDDPAVEQRYADALATSTAPGPEPRPRPSMETGFHLALPRAWVTHVHALSALLLAHELRRQGDALRRWIAERSRLDVCFLPGIRPGFLLARAIELAPPADAYVLANHGLVVQDDGPPDRPGSTLAQWSELERRFCDDFGYPGLGALLAGPSPAPPPPPQPAPFKVYFPDNAVFRDRIEKVLVPAGSAGGASLWRLADDAWSRDRDAAEIWSASQLLHGWCPELAELDTRVSATVADLPTELFRRRAPTP